MEITLYGGKLKISLGRQDMLDLSLTYQDMDYKDEATKRALLYLLEKAKEETGFSPRGAKLFIEIYPGEDGGCVLYFTTVSKTVRHPDGQSGMEPVLFEFDDVDLLIQGACKTFWRYGHRIYKSALYRMGNRYRLIVYPLDYSDRLSVYFLSEYGAKIGEGEILAAYTREHGKEIIGENAINLFAEYFGESG